MRLIKFERHSHYPNAKTSPVWINPEKVTAVCPHHDKDGVFCAVYTVSENWLLADTAEVVTERLMATSPQAPKPKGFTEWAGSGERMK